MEEESKENEATKFGILKGLLVGKCGFNDKNCEGRQKVAAFDMDYTLIKTKSGRKFPKNSSDWIFWESDIVPQKLRKLHEDEFRVVVFTN